MTAGPSYEYRVELGKTREFAKALQSSNPEFCEGPRPVVLPTFLVTATQWGPDDFNLTEFVGFDRKRILHGSQEYRYFGEPPRAGDVLTAHVRLTDRYEKKGGRGGLMQFAVVSTEFRDASGAVVAESRMTLIETAPKPAGGQQ